jgi:8-oxo-dGTP pyrophosphatase MutT (NUDIX family)
MTQVNVNIPAPLSRVPNFDARKVPAVAVDDDLPAIPKAALTPAALRARFAAALDWTPEIRREPWFGTAPGEAAPAAVLVPIVMRPEPTVLLTQRSTKLSKHSGQVAFPGGRVDPGDASIEDAALREALEEVGLDAERVEIIGTLPSYTTGTAFVVTPVVGLVRPPLDLHINPQEVDVAFEVPLAFLMNPANHRHHEYVADGVRRTWISMPYMDNGHDRFVWGATAGMLRNLYRFLSAGQ